MFSPEVIEAAREYHRQRDAKQRNQRETYRHEWLVKAQVAIRTLAPNYTALRCVYLFGSIMQPGRFRCDSDIDVAVECSDLEQESAFWRAMEHTLRRNVDVRPYVDGIVRAVAWSGKLVYERESLTAQ